MKSSSDQVATYTTESMEEKVDSVMVAEKDTLKEVTRVTVLLRQVQDPLAPPDTIRVSTVTDRTRARSRDAIATQRTKLEVRTDTVFIEQDSVIVKEVAVNGNQSGKTTLHTTLKWLCAVICAVIVLVLVLKILR